MKNVTADEVKNLIQVFDDSEWKELAMQVDDIRVFLSRDPNSAGAPWQSSATPAPAPAATAPTLSAPQAAAVPENCLTVTAPNLGIFYRAPKPGEAPYVEVGDEVGEDTEICLIEVMKLFTQVQAGVSGTIRAICVEDGEMVEQGHALFYIEPAE